MKTHFEVLHSTVILIRLANNYFEVEDRINDALLDLSGMRFIGLMAIRNPEKYNAVHAVRLANLRYHRRKLYALLLPYAPDNVKRSRLYKDKAKFWGA